MRALTAINLATFPFVAFWICDFSPPLSGDGVHEARA